MSPTEHVLVVPTSLFHELGHFHGWTSDVDRYLDVLTKPEHTSFRPRDQVEQDPSFKQLIPYVVFRYVDEEGTAHLFQYTRGTGQGEARLHSKRSIGVGGHISSEDQPAPEDDPYAVGMARELAEEIVIDTPYRAQRVGLINDDETEVGRVHLGVVHLFDVERPSISAREAELADGGFRPMAELLEQMDEFETWSQICFESLLAVH